jgi:hypothetical protein
MKRETVYIATVTWWEDNEHYCCQFQFHTKMSCYRKIKPYVDYGLYRVTVLRYTFLHKRPYPFLSFEDKTLIP